MKLVETVGFAAAYSFKYSARPGTPAAALGMQIEESVKDQRLARLQDAIARGATAFNATTVGNIVPVLFDRAGRRPARCTAARRGCRRCTLPAPHAWSARSPTCGSTRPIPTAYRERS